jgi:hypothetical protein
LRLFEGWDDETPDVSDGIGVAEALLGLDGFRVLEVTETPDEVTVTIETDAELGGSRSWPPNRP